MPELLAAFLRAIEHVKGPLTFWAFCATIVLGLAVVALRSPRWLALVLRTSEKKLTGGHTFRLFRIVAWMFFVLAVLVVLLAFAAPVLLERAKQNQTVEESLSDYETFLKRTIATDTALQSARALIQRGEYESAALAFEQVFGRDVDRTPAGLQGFVVASFVKEGNYAAAARAVLDRDRLSRGKDRSLWFDLAYALRAEALVRSLPSAQALVDSLLAEYGPKLVSHVWPTLPLSVAYGLREGIHKEDYALSPSHVRDIQSVIRMYPDDPYLDFAQYALRHYQTALAAHPQSLIRDHLIYATARNTRDLNLARALYVQYVKEYPHARQADDAALELAFLLRNSGDLQGALDWFEKARSMGNEDTWTSPHEFATLRDLPSDQLHRILVSRPKLAEPARLWYVLARRYHHTGDYQRSRRIASEAIQALIRTHPDGMQWFEELHLEELKYLRAAATAIDSVNRKPTPEGFLVIANRFRREHRDFRTAIRLLDQARARYSASPFAPRYAFLALLAYRDWFPANLDSVVNAFIRIYPKHGLADDALAELSHVQFEERQDPAAGNLTVERLQRQYPSSNAVDNALYWQAVYYWLHKNRARAGKIFSAIALQYPQSRYKSYLGRR